MLISLKIKNFALVENAEVGFSSGLNVISGESGSGKSILIGALFVLLGGRSDKECIREGEKRCETEAILKVTPQIKAKLQDFFARYDIEDCGDELSLRRVLQENSARSYVNGANVPLKCIREIAGIFFDFNRPDEELSLNSQSRQLELLDRSGGIDCAECQKLFAELSALENELKEFDSASPDENEVEEAKEFVSLMDKYNFAEDEEETLVQKHKILSNSRELINIAARVSQLLSGEENSVADALSAVMREFYAMDKLADGTLSELLEQAENLNVTLNTLQNTLDTFASSLELDGEALQEVENRLDVLYRLKRRYGPSFQELFINYERAKVIVNKAANGTAVRRQLIEKITSARQKLDCECEKISSKRKSAAMELEKSLLAELASLGFKKCRFEWSFSKIQPSAAGSDELDILFSANSGERVLPLRKIASSGERSRLFLAIKNVLARVDDIPVVIFDEIDANIGGETANKVGHSLHELGKYRQIISISHLAQIAVFADTHLQVVKYVREDGRTVSEVRPLDTEGRISELARMLGNADGAEDYARKMLER
ncbi:MAG: DNA repair protein RecN [Lentisphaeria bacterium]|nr:DNA repair protein RecN [Lentisphaeria bacterium]